MKDKNIHFIFSFRTETRSRKMISLDVEMVKFFQHIWIIFFKFYHGKAKEAIIVPVLIT